MSPPSTQSPSTGPSPAAQRHAPVGSARGVFVAFEGGDGAGKSTQIGHLMTWLAAQGRPATLTREPGGTPLGAQLRALLLHGDHVGPHAEALLFAADRAHHVDVLVRPALAAGEVVVTDRFMDSSIAYQGAGRALDPGEVRRLSLWACAGLVPDLTVVLDVAPHVGRARRAAADDRLEAEPDDFHARVRALFLDLAAAEPHRYLVLDGGAPAREIAAEVRARVAPLLAGGAS